MRQARGWLPIATGLAGLAAGWFLAGRLGAPAETGAAVLPPLQLDAPPAFHADGAQGLSLEDLRRVVREELAAAALPGGGKAREAESTPRPELTGVQVAAGQRARQLLDGAIGRGRWSDAEVDAMKGVFDQLTAEQQAEVLQHYATAVNQGRLVPETDRPPF